MKKLDRGYEREFNEKLNLPDFKEKLTSFEAISIQNKEL